MEHKNLWILVGPPAAGKSWFAKHKLMIGPGWMYISRDEIRFSLIKEEEDYFSHEKEVYKKFIYNIYSALNSEGIFNVIADATHLNWASRNKLIINLKKIYRDFEYLNIIPVVVESDIETVLKRNDARTGRAKVVESAVCSMFAQYTDPATDPYEYTGIMYIKNGEQKTLINKPKFMYKKNDIHMKEYTIKDTLKRKG